MKQSYEALLKNIPDYKTFLTVEEMSKSSRALSQQYPDVVELMEIGRTRDNAPLECLKIGNGKHVGLMFGCPHPNEPIGAMMLEYLSEALAKDAALRKDMDYTWYIIKVWDVDGTKLNENWFKGPYTIYNYSRNFFRPAGHQQVDWTFPLDYKNLHFDNSIPETKAMMTLIDTIKPEFIYSLHNAGFGGVYWYITHETAGIYDKLRQNAISQDVPLNLGEPEAPYCTAYSPAIYQSLGIQQEYDYLESYGIDQPEKSINVGTCSADYAKSRYDSFTLLTELPYFYDARIKDLSESDMLRKDTVLENLEYSEKTNIFIVETLNAIKPYLDPQDPFKLALEAFTDMAESNEATKKMVSTNPDFAKKATVAEKFDNLLVAKFYKSLSYGLLVRAAETALEKMKESGEVNAEKTAILTEKMQTTEAELKKLTDYLEKEINYQVVPIRKLIHIQLESGLDVIEYLKSHH